MDAVLNVVLGALSKVFAVASGIAGGVDSVTSVLQRFSVPIFIGGFFGLLLAFLWFFFRYLDKKRLALPALLFTIFFLIFLGGNLLLITRDTDSGSVSIERGVAEVRGEAEDR